MLYRQCRFRRGDERTIGWIEAHGAIVGASVEILTLDDGDPWLVESVGDKPIGADKLGEMQRLNRNSLSSLKDKDQ